MDGEILVAVDGDMVGVSVTTTEEITDGDTEGDALGCK